MALTVAGIANSTVGQTISTGIDKYSKAKDFVQRFGASARENEKFLTADKVDPNSYILNFYYSFLLGNNNLPINSLWIVKMDPMPTANNILKIKNDTIHQGLGSMDYARSEAYGSRQEKGILFAHGVNVPGDAIETEKVGYNNSGYVRGTISNGKTDYDKFSIVFLENTISFVDLYLRPWIAAIGKEGLLNSSFKTKITVEQLTKMDKYVQFAPRKSITFHNCSPVSVYSQEYNYSGSDVLVRRQVQFNFDWYTIDDIAQPFITQPGYELAPSEEAKKRIAKLGGELNKNSFQKFIEGSIDQAKQYGKNLIFNTAGSMINSVEGAVGDVVGSLVTQAKAAGWDIANSISGAVSDAMTDMANSVLDRTGLEDNPTHGNSAAEIMAGAADTPGYRGNSTRFTLGQPTRIDVAKKIGENDTPSFANIREIDAKIVVDPPVTDVTPPHIPTDAKVINPDDVTNFLNIKGTVLDVRLKSINQEDTPYFKGPVSNIKEKSINEDDTPKIPHTQASQTVIKSDDHITLAMDKSSQKVIKQDDLPSKISTSEIPVNQDDVPSKYSAVEIPVNLNDYLEKNHAGTKLVTIKENDTRDSINFKSVKINENDNLNDDYKSPMLVKVKTNQINFDSLSYVEVKAKNP